MSKRMGIGCGRVAVVCGICAASLAAAAGPVETPLSDALEKQRPDSALPADLAAAMVVRDDSGSATPSKAAWIKDDAAPVLRLESPGRLKSPDQASVKWTVGQTIHRGDVLLLRLLARTVTAQQESGEAMFQVAVQQDRPAFARHVVLPLSVGPAWTQFDVPFVADADAAPDQAELILAYGFLPQSMEVADLRLLDFGNRAKTAELPQTRLTYKGRETGAAWRTAALARIEKLRTAAITVRVIDAAGRPVPEASVEARLVRPAFVFGTAVDAAFLLDDSADAERYRKTLLELFDTTVFDNALKWPRWSGSVAGRDMVLRAADWLATHGLRVRGHNLVWPGDKFSPKRVAAMPPPRAALPLLIQEHIRDEATALRGRLIAWDVINEMLHEHDYFKFMPESEAAAWFKTARACDPDAKLFLNEYGMLNGPKSPQMIADYVALSERLRSLGAPIDALGVQGHVGRTVRDPEDVLSDLDLLAKSGLPVQITEFDINTPDEQLQADYLRDFLIAVYSHPNVTGFTMWGFWQRKHWKPDAAMLRADWSEKQSAKVWRDLVCGQWRTHATVTTDVNGTVATRGHLGEYVFDVKAGNRTQREERMLTTDGLSATIQLAE